MPVLMIFLISRTAAVELVANSCAFTISWISQHEVPLTPPVLRSAIARLHFLGTIGTMDEDDWAEKGIQDETDIQP